MSGSKMNPQVVQPAISALLKASKGLGEKGADGVKPKKRNFVESIDLLINLKNYDPQKDKRFSGSIRLPRIARPRFDVCVIADAYHVDQAAKGGIPCLTVEDLKKVGKNKKLVKKLCSEHDAFIASESLIKQIPKLCGPHFNRAGKFPTSVTQADSLDGKVEEIRSMIKFQLKKSLCLGACIGHVDMTEDDVRVNLNLSMNFLVSLLKKGWQNLKSVYIKSTMGAPHQIF